MIEFQNISNMDKEEIINLLLDQKEQPFQIYVPKSTVLYSSSNEDIAIDYAMLAFVGEQLNKVSEKFEYEYVSPHEHKSVLFKIYSKNIESLAETILELSYGYNNDIPEDEEEFIFHELVTEYLEKVKEGSIKPVCKDFFEDYDEFIRK